VYRFLLHPKWLGFLAGCAVFAVFCVLLGLWQFDRMEQRRAHNARVEAGRASEPVSYGTLFSAGRAPKASDEYRQVRITGSYDGRSEYLVRGRTQNRQAGVYVLTPLVTESGERVLVVRGWAPFSPKGASVAPDVPAATAGEVTVTGRVRRSEDPAGRAVEIGAYRSVTRIDAAGIGRELGVPVADGYAELIKQDPPAPAGLQPVPEPELTDGPHLAYGVQWFLFAGLGFVAYVMFARREAERRAAPQAAPVSPAPVPPAR
jgi:cytochrome oxidase assembly protein ShyY1